MRGTSAQKASRNQYSKQLIDVQDEIAEMRKKFKILGHQVEQLQAELAAEGAPQRSADDDARGIDGLPDGF